ncbi:MAG: magnesium transporter CorA family protein [Candidatus Nitrosocosmicus sp.]
MEKTIIHYNENDVVEEKGSKEYIIKGYNLWIDVIDPTSFEIFDLQKTFNLDHKAVEKIEQHTKKPQAMIFKNHRFTVFLSLKFNTINHLEKNPIYFLAGDGWLITIHSEQVDLLTKGRIMFSQGKKILESSIDALYYSLLSSMVESYEQILTAIEIKVIEIEETAQHRPSKHVLEYIDLLSRQIIVLRRHFWQARHVINYHTYLEEDTDDIKYLKIVYDDINQLIEMVQSYQDTINSTRETFASSISLQTNDVMKILTIFSTIVLPLSLLISIFSLQGFDLNNLAVIPKYFYILIIIMVIITGLSLFVFWKKGWIFSRETRTIEKRDDKSD